LSSIEWVRNYSERNSINNVPTAMIPVENFSSGVYVVQINTVSETYRRKIIKN
jgi:hypothetical protein